MCVSSFHPYESCPFLLCLNLHLVIFLLAASGGHLKADDAHAD